MKNLIWMLLILPMCSFGIEYHEDQTYGGGEKHTYDLAIGESKTLLILVHGGGWIGGDKKAVNFDNGEAVKYIAERYGLNVASINYVLATEDRPTAPLDINGPLPRPTHNVMTAATVIRDRVSAERVVLLGTSAGANISALTYLYYPDVIDSFIGFYGPYDLTKPGEFSYLVRGMINTYTGGDEDKVFAASPTLSPLWPDRKVLLFHGDVDDTVDVNQSIVLSEVIDAELYTLELHNHAFKVFGEKSNPAPWVERLIRFTYTGE